MPTKLTTKQPRRTTRYAEGTPVAVQDTKIEIEAELIRFGATARGWATDDAARVDMILFRLQGRSYAVPIPKPDPSDEANRSTKRGAWVSEPDPIKLEQRLRENYRGVLFYVKSILIAVQSGIITTETAFLPYALLPDGSTVGQWADRDLRGAYERGEMPRALPGMGPLLLPPARDTDNT